MKRILMALLTIAAVAHADDTLDVAIYAPTAFSDTGARLTYVQGLARAIQDKTGVVTTGKVYVRLSDLVAAKPSLAIIDGQCLAAHAPGTILAAAVIGGDTSQTWGLFSRDGAALATLKGKKLAFARTECRDDDFMDNAMLDSEVKTSAFFGSLAGKPDVAGAVSAVRDASSADAVFAPASEASGLTKLFDTGSVPNPGFVVLSTLPPAIVAQVKEAVLGYGGGGGIDGWKATTSGYGSLAGRMGTRTKRPIFAVPDVVRMEDQDMLILPTSAFKTATVKQHFWDPTADTQQ